jgi:hypothetical protein
MADEDGDVGPPGGRRGPASRALVVPPYWKSAQKAASSSAGIPITVSRNSSSPTVPWCAPGLTRPVKFESSFTAALPLIHQLAGKEQPTHSDATRLQSVPHSVVALDPFFQQAGPGWFPLLRRKGYLRDPPPLEVADDDTIAYVRWPAGRYLARMAAEPSIRRDVVEVALALETDNPQAHEGVAEAALALPAGDAARLAPKVAGFLASPYSGVAVEGS